MQVSKMFRRGFVAALLLLAAAVGAEERERALIPLPAIFYGPETGVGGGVALLYTWPGPEEEAPNQAAGILFYTQKRQIISALTTEVALGEGETRLLIASRLRRYPDTYFGIGSDTPDSAEESYTPLEGELEAGFLRRVLPGFSLGPSYRFRYSALQETEAGGELDSGLVPGSDHSLVSGLGLRLRYDIREGGFAPRRGFYAELSGGLYGRLLGGSEDFGRLKLDVRHYLPLAAEAGPVLALQGLFDSGWGEVPFQELPQLGGDMMMRGYLAGRYRDKVYAAVQGELRVPLFWRLGGVLFAAAGQVAPELGALDFSSPRTAAGAGLRVLVNRSQNLNLRLDMALSPEAEGPAVYVRAMEAF